MTCDDGARLLILIAALAVAFASLFLVVAWRTMRAARARAARIIRAALAVEEALRRGLVVQRRDPPPHERARAE